MLIIIVMERDYRLTGKIRGQSDIVAAPPAFEGRCDYAAWVLYNKANNRIVNSRWKVCQAGMLELDAGTDTPPRLNLELLDPPSPSNHLMLPRRKSCTYDNYNPERMAGVRTKVHWRLSKSSIPQMHWAVPLRNICSTIDSPFRSPGKPKLNRLLLALSLFTMVAGQTTSLQTVPTFNTQNACLVMSSIRWQDGKS